MLKSGTRIGKEMTMKLRPLDDGVVIKPSEAEEKTSGGIYLPDTAKQKPQIGKVVAVGPGKILENGKRSPMNIKKNDEVVFPRYIGSDVEIDGVKYVILKESDILGIVEK
jgi:chaperonin GroES